MAAVNTARGFCTVSLDLWGVTPGGSGFSYDFRALRVVENQPVSLEWAVRIEPKTKDGIVHPLFTYIVSHGGE